MRKFLFIFVVWLASELFSDTQFTNIEIRISKYETNINIK